MAFAFFDLTYNGTPIEQLIGVHPVFQDGPTIQTGEDALWAELQACLDFGIDPDIEFAKNRYSRMLITGGAVASRSVRSMREYDMEILRSQQAEMARKRRGK